MYEPTPNLMVGIHCENLIVPMLCLPRASPRLNLLYISDRKIEDRLPFSRTNGMSAK